MIDPPCKHAFEETAFFFGCEGASLLGVLAAPVQRASRVAVVIVVGGPQYRVGSHREFVRLARALAREGLPCLRFDYRGMGDSEGPRQPFDDVDDDLRCAVDELARRVPSVRDVVLWGLCDGASASAFYAMDDPRIAGLALCNPWVRTEQGAARAQVTHYYARRVLQPAFWTRLLAGDVPVRESTKSFLQELGRAVRGRGRSSPLRHLDVPERTASALLAFSKPVLVVLSGNDVVAAEFRGRCGAALEPLRQRGLLTEAAIPRSDHTFSNAAWFDEMLRLTLHWLAYLPQRVSARDLAVAPQD